MAKIKLKYSIGGPYETLYFVELKRSHEEETSVTKRPHKPCMSGGKSASEAQKEHRQHFKEAIAYAKAATAQRPRSVAEWDGRP